jgi:hypothetical protein
LASPVVDILEEVVMDGAIMEEIQRSLGQRLVCACAGDFRLESVRFGLSSQVKPVHQNG